MALQSDFTMNGGIIISAAYHRITQVNIMIDENRANLSVSVYKDKATRDANGLPFAHKSFPVEGDNFTNFLTPTDVNPLNINHVSQAYEYLKTLPEYQGALDV